MSSERLLLGEQIGLAILAHAASCAPNECCGLLATDRKGTVRFAYPLTNVDPSPVSYTVDPDEHFHALRHAEAQGWEITGAFHSHPSGPATPSTVDVQTALDPSWVYLVAAPDEVRAFRIANSAVEEIALDWMVTPKR